MFTDVNWDDAVRFSVIIEEGEWFVSVGIRGPMNGFQYHFREESDRDISRKEMISLKLPILAITIKKRWRNVNE